MNTSASIDEDETSGLSESEDFVQESQRNTQDDIDEEFFDASEDFQEDDVLGMAMAEKTNALIRGKSTDFDRTFVPRGLETIDLEAGNAGETLSPARQTSTASFPGAYRVREGQQQSTPRADSLSHLSAVSEENSRDKTVVVPRASLVREGSQDVDPENPSALLSRKPVAPIAEVVESEEEGQESESANKAARSRKRRIFRYAVLLGLLMIAAVLVAILVQVTRTNNSRPPPKPPKRRPPKNDENRGNSSSAFSEFSQQNRTNGDGDFREDNFGGR